MSCGAVRMVETPDRWVENLRGHYLAGEIEVEEFVELMDQLWSGRLVEQALWPMAVAARKELDDEYADHLPVVFGLAAGAWVFIAVWERAGF